ncbi:VanZ family protein [uncultured Clostridium sp.]|uniref:VanZ family protein n=1 Tax=uncultured Clostridium sp. TaxID=59620 RepID=UPI0025F7A895|nr:VanZ family protein [uncultured Clostridium sp.]
MKRMIVSVLCLMWIGFIFFNSSQNGAISHSVSTKFSKELFQNFIYHFNLNISDVDIIIRKCAHVFEYMILAIIIRICLKIMEIKNKNIILLVLILIISIACLDETLQLFIRGRTSKILDVFIDLSGGIIGCIICSIIYRIISRFFCKHKYSC